MADEAQYIDLGRVQGAQKRIVTPLADEPLILGVDVSGGGGAWTVGRYRRGLDGRSIPPIRITGQRSQDRDLLITTFATALSETHGGVPITAMFVDSAFGSVIVDRLRQMNFHNVFEVNFGADSPEDTKDANQRAYQYRLMKEWLPRGGIPADDERLETDLTGPGFHLDKRNRLVIESKDSMAARGVASPDDGDALSLTFARPVLAVQASGGRAWPSGSRAGIISGRDAWAG